MAFVDNRQELDNILRELLGTNEVYFQPPESIKIKYPCIIYNRENGDIQYANNKAYTFSYRYQIMYIDRNPDSDFPVRLIQRLPKCVYDRHFTADNLNHEIFNIYY